ncbi:MAG: glycoside hydrolase family 5 protein [Prevotella sp.]|nr:glycoside hydrolase family 5 protein [Prevotella sp.]
MKHLKAIILLLAIISIQSRAMEHDVDAQTWCKNVVMGWNLGNSLEAEGTETSWGNPATTADMIKAIKGEGFNAVRIPVRWGQHCDMSTMTIDEKWLSRVKEIVDWCLAEDMYVIINTHHDLWLEHYPTNAKKTELNEKLGKLWTNIATAFADYDGRLAFAGLNEVNAEGNWGLTPTQENYDVTNSFNQTFVDAVRATGGNNAQRNLIVQSYRCNPTMGLTNLVVPTDPTPNRLSVEYHYYDPYSYCSGAAGSYNYWGIAFSDKGTVTPDGNEKSLANFFLTIREKWWEQGLGVVIGEYGCSCHYTTADKATQEANMQYYMKCLVSEARKNGFAAFVWDNNAYGNGSEKFGIFDRKNGMKVRTPFFLDGIKEGSSTQYVADVDYNMTDKDFGVGGKQVWSGNQVIDWGKPVTIPASEFKNFTTQATIVIYYDQDAFSDYEDIQPCDSKWERLSFTVEGMSFSGDFNPRSFYGTSGKSHITPMIFTGAELNSLKSGGVIIQGHGITFTKIVLMDTPNAIHLPTVNPDSDAPFYNLRGVKVLNPAKGNVYIVNGKKIIR